MTFLYSSIFSIVVTYIIFFNKIMIQKVTNPKIGYLTIFFSFILIITLTLNEIIKILKIKLQRENNILDINNIFKLFLCFYAILIFFTTKYSGRVAIYILLPLALYKVYKEKKYSVTNLEVPIFLFLFGIILSAVNSLYKSEVIDNFIYSFEGCILPLLIAQFKLSKETLKIIFSIGFIGMLWKLSKSFLELAGYITPFYNKVRISGGEEVFKYAPVIMIGLIGVIIYFIFKKKEELKVSIVLGYFGVLSFLIIIMSQNRANWLALCIIIAILILIKGNKKIIFGSTILVLFLVLFKCNYENNRYYKRLKTMTSTKELSKDSSFLIRLEIAEEGLKIFKNNYLTGIGYSKKSYEKAQKYIGYKYIKEGTNHIEAHNTYVQSLASTGIIGFLGYITMIIAIFIKFLKKEDIYSKLALYTLIGIQINGMFVSILQYRHITGLYFLIIGLGLSCHTKNYYKIKFLTKKSCKTHFL